jgi:DNA-binding XRE family transcriptional regulator
MKKQTPRLQSVAVLPELVVSATYTDGRTVTVSMRDVIKSYPAFAPLDSAEECATVQITDWGFTLEWKCGMSLDCDRFFELSLEQSDMLENVRFRQWQDSHALSLAEAAKAIGLSRRTISQYRTGARPVPRVVALACKGWSNDQMKVAA